MKFNEQIKLNKTSENENLTSQEKDFDNLKNIEEVFKLNPELENIALKAIKSDRTITLYRIENKNIERESDGITSHQDLKGQWFTPNFNTTLTYLRKSQQTFGADAKRVEGVNLVIVKASKEEYEKLNVSNHPIASQMDVENDNYIIPESIKREYINIDDVQDKVGNFENFQKAKEQIINKLKLLEQKETIKLYEKYLETIFPESKVKDIVCHGSDKKIEKYNEPTAELSLSRPAIYFRKNFNNHLKDNKISNFAIVNSEFPLIVEDFNEYSERRSRIFHDSVYIKNEDEFAVFDPEQIHILGNKQDIEKFKEFVQNKNEMQKIDDLSFEEVSPNTPDSIEIEVYKDDSEEVILKKLKEKLVRENWWLQDEFEKEGMPKEQFLINGNNEYSIYNFNENLSEEQKSSLVKGISFLENSSEISSIKGITILIRKTERINSNSKQPFYGNNYSDSKVINIYPRALENKEYRDIPEINGLGATIIHEFSHPIYDKMEQKIKEEWSNFGWEVTTEEERENKNMYAIKPKESNKCITKYAQFAPDEDFCESVVGLYANSSKLDSEKKKFLENNIFNKNQNITLSEIIKKEKVELPKLPEKIKYYKKEKQKIFIIKK